MNAMTRTAIAILAPLLIHSVTLAWSPTATSSRRPTTAAIKLRFPPTTMQPSLNSKSSTRLLNQDLQNIDGPTQTSAESVATLAESVPPPPQPLAQTISQPAAPARSKSFGKGVWVPPSQNVSQRRGEVFAIQQPQDLLDFVIEDERLSVGEYCTHYFIPKIYYMLFLA